MKSRLVHLMALERLGWEIYRCFAASVMEPVSATTKPVTISVDFYQR